MSNDEKNDPKKPAKRRRSHRTRPVGKCGYATDSAAAKLDTTVGALRQRARRHSRAENGQTIARLGMGVVARKFGATWRFYFNEEEGADAT